MKDKQFRKSKVEKKKKNVKLNYPPEYDSSKFIHRNMEQQMKIKSKLNYEPDTTSRKMASQIK